MRKDVASRTAVLVCQGRALAQGRLAVGRFDDPVARGLLRPDERAEVDAAGATRPPKGWAARLRREVLRATAPVMALRTVVIDDAIRDAAHPQLVVLGAGLDARAWRMAELAGVEVYEVDHPATQREKLDRLAGREPLAGSVTFVAADLTRDALATVLASAGHDRARSSMWVWEGVVPYLTADQVDRTLVDIAACSAPGSRLTVNYVDQTVLARVGRVLASVLLRLGRSANPWSNEPWRSSWPAPAMAQLLRRHGFEVVSDPEPLDVAAQLGIPSRAQTLRHGRVVTADRGASG